MMTNRKAKKILKKYAKAAYKERIVYVDSMSNSAPSYVSGIRWHQMIKRGFVIALVLTLTFVLVVISASALGIKLFNFSFFDKQDHVEIISNESGEKDNHAKVQFYRIGYVPKEYTFLSKDEFEGINLNYVYENSNGDYLYIEQTVADGYRENLDNENCTVSTKTICEMETYIYDYGEQKVYMMQHDNIFISITGNLSDKEFEEIIYGLKFD